VDSFDPGRGLKTLTLGFVTIPIQQVHCDETSWEAPVVAARKPAGSNLLPTGKRKILLADDDASVRESLAGVLVGEGYEVILAVNGREAVAKCLFDAPDLVLLDLNMPDRNGWQAFDEMERFRPLLPVIVITALPNQYDRALGGGIDALMEKPLDLPQLLQKIKELLAESACEHRARIIDRDFFTVHLPPATEAKIGVQDQARITKPSAT
jgi:CheY-like chemotaxis protein